MTFDYDLFVIGAGSGGVRAARASAGHGAKVAVAEEHRVGGTCVIRGCVPKKLLVYGAQLAGDLRDAHRFGWDVEGRGFDWARLRDNVLAEVDRLNRAYAETLNRHGVDIFPQRAAVSGPNEVTLADGRRVTARVILIATGATPHRPLFAGHEYGITSNEAFHLERLPDRVLIAGAGYIANEFAGIFNGLGSRVTIVNRSGAILRGFDEALRDRLLTIYQAKGIEFRFHAAFERIDRTPAGDLRVVMPNHEPMNVDCVLFATGRVPNTRGLGLEEAGVELDEAGGVRVDADGRTSCPSIHAVGDVTNRIQLTPVAIREGQAFADSLFGGKPWRVDYDHVPAAVFSQPPMAGIGMTEAQARTALGEVTVHQSDFRPMRNSLAGRDERALYKMVCDAQSGRIVGLHMIGPEAPEILQAAAIAVRAGLTKADFDCTVALHPSMAEELVLMK